MSRYLVQGEWVVEDQEAAFRLAEALKLMGAAPACTHVEDRPDGFHRGCSREGCPCHRPGPVCDECMCVGSETRSNCPRCGWSHDKHAVCGYRTEATA